jgi:hypothetical protein
MTTTPVPPVPEVPPEPEKKPETPGQPDKPGREIIGPPVDPQKPDVHQPVVPRPEPPKPETSRARSHAALTGALLAPLAAGCTVPLEEAPPGEVPPGALTQELQQEALRAAPPSDLHVVPRAFAEAVRAFGIAVQRLEERGGALDVLDGALFQRLADALEQVPRGPLVGAPAAAASLRIDALALGDPREIRKPQVAARALMTAATALLDLARGPYRHAPDVLTEARALAEAATIANAGAPTPEVLGRGLRTAERTLAAIEAATHR